MSTTESDPSYQRFSDSAVSNNADTSISDILASPAREGSTGSAASTAEGGVVQQRTPDRKKRVSKDTRSKSDARQAAFSSSLRDPSFLEVPFLKTRERIEQGRLVINSFTDVMEVHIYVHEPR